MTDNRNSVLAGPQRKSTSLPPGEFSASPRNVTTKIFDRTAPHALYKATLSIAPVLKEGARHPSRQAAWTRRTTRQELGPPFIDMYAFPERWTKSD